MAKRKYRKPRPSIPEYGWWNMDGCWNCKNRNGCGGCKFLKRIAAEQKEKQRRESKRKFDFE